jgi:hypothetical protein
MTSLAAQNFGWTTQRRSYCRTCNCQNGYSQQCDACQCQGFHLSGSYSQEQRLKQSRQAHRSAYAIH